MPQHVQEVEELDKQIIVAMLVSVVIPIYNVAVYIEACLQSVMRQTFRDLEVLLVDDCATDDSIDIVRRLLGNREEAVIDGIHFSILHHSQNRGLSAARNTGIEAAHGEWIYLLDSDDWIEADCIATLVQTATQEEGIEMAIGQLQTSDEQGHKDVRLPNGDICPTLQLRDGVYAGNILQHYLAREIYEMAWNKLISREFLLQHELRFKEGLIHEDALWSFCCACQLQKVAVVNKVLYHYRIHFASIMSQSVGTKRALAYNTILSSQIDYALTHGWGDNKAVFDFLFPKIKRYFLRASYQEHPALAEDLYRKLNASHFWTYRQLYRMVYAKRDLIAPLCRFLPDFIGVWFLRHSASWLRRV